ncbi:hypothetical protein BFI39_17810 [Yersinia pestis subsp. microtus bv. Talassica]|nr:hypothetical protein AC597_16145 [Yersinia pestis subsp. microtus bv. Talassica]KPD69258.1 hypothetical protein ADT35_16330 [Yersinia pestis subsp. microtus bv. Talassica]OMK96520.1 hypothetical protein BFI39_17810 [Yersinia pestis subsp. microtus bv. Talassica]
MSGEGGFYLISMHYLHMPQINDLANSVDVAHKYDIGVNFAHCFSVF